MLKRATGVPNIQYRVKTSSGWQAQVGLTDLAYNQGLPNLIWAEWPDPSVVRTDVPETGYALVYTGQDAAGYKVVYYASEDLTWGVKAPEAVVGGTLLPMGMLEAVNLWIILGVAALAVAAVMMRRRRALT